jgi:hypothetical protein
MSGAEVRDRWSSRVLANDGKELEGLEDLLDGDRASPRKRSRKAMGEPIAPKVLDRVLIDVPTVGEYARAPWLVQLA